jgi:hypothetical protein
MKRWRLGIGLLLVALVGAGWLATRSSPDFDAAAAQALEPSLLATFGADPAVADAAAWRERRAPLLRAAFQAEIYGQVPKLPPAEVVDRHDVAVPDLGDAAHVEEWSVVLGEGRFQMLVITPPNARGPLPLVVMQTFCGNRAFLPGEATGLADSGVPGECESEMMQPLIHFILGRYISTPPIAEIMARGYALASFYPGDVVADHAGAVPALEALGGTPRAGALAAWAGLYSRAYDVLAADSRFDPRRIAIWGHSRHGKAALLAGAFDDRFAAVISHQSGRFGASPTASDRGERRDQILKNYSYWFTDRLTIDSPLSVDQHQLIALNAPRPLLLGNGAGDGWSDPAGSWEALRGAHDAYALLGARGLTQTAPRTADFTGDLVYFQRGGGHGITPADWRAFLAFLDAHLMVRHEALDSRL